MEQEGQKKEKVKLIAVHFRLPEPVVDEIKKEAEAEGVTVSDVLRARVADEQVKPLNQPRRRRRETLEAGPKTDPALIRELARIGNNLNQLARHANQHKSAVEAVEICSILYSIETEVRKLSNAH
jgi:hypothetical protein